jgi:hypothetical protein
MLPIDLKAIAADRYRLTLDESASLPSTDPTAETKAWCRQIPCRYGHIGVHSDRELSAYCSASRLFRSLLEIPTTRQRQRGDSELTVTFEPEHLEQVADLLKARRKRQISDSERQRLAAMSREHSPFRVTAPSVALSK